MTGVQTCALPILQSIFNKIGLDNEFKNNVIENIKSKGSLLIANMNDCKTLSNFISNSISEELTKKLDTENIVKSDVINSSLLDMINNDNFKANLNTKLENNVCELFDKFTENAKNLVVRMSAL